MSKFNLIVLALGAALCAEAADPTEEEIREEFQIDALGVEPWLEAMLRPLMHLTEADYHRAAQELHCDDAAIHAVIEIEAGSQHQGLYDQGCPVVYFSADMFRKNAKKRGINLSKAQKSHPEVFAGPNDKKYGGRNAAQWARMQGAMAIDSVAAIESAYWGMFQIAGFNWKRCGCASPQEFARRMATSEQEQLELFVNFLHTTGLDVPLQKLDWTRFARGYNGPSYAKRGYHTRLSRAYNKWK